MAFVMSLPPVEGDKAAYRGMSAQPRAAQMLPPACYVADDATRAEVETLFRQGWIGVGRADIVPAPGDFITLDLAGQSIILLRDKSERLRAFPNTCRHRGARLLDGSGSCRGLRCPFHSWFYGLDGRLVAAPRMEHVAGFDRADYGLHAYRAEERLGFVFLRLADKGPDLGAHLGDFAEIHAPWPLETLVTVRRRVFEVACNWKVFLEVFNEYYHLPFVHADSIDGLYALPDAPDPVDGSFATQFGATEGTGGLLQDAQENALPAMPGLTGRAAAGARYTWVFPNMTFAANRDALWCYEAYPFGPARCTVVQSACFPRETVERADFAEKAQAYLARLDAALAEDEAALLNQQRGLACPDARPGPFQPDLEPSVARFAAWYAARMSGAAAEGDTKTEGEPA
ncbi:MAG: aromatic ring-hydroxylating dioxygenase subunit alpha [Pseudomonadota bacterium]